jgi:hypothetical protein
MPVTHGVPGCIDICQPSVNPTPRHPHTNLNPTATIAETSHHITSNMNAKKQTKRRPQNFMSCHSSAQTSCAITLDYAKNAARPQNHDHVKKCLCLENWDSRETTNADVMIDGKTKLANGRDSLRGNWDDQ